MPLPVVRILSTPGVIRNISRKVVKTLVFWGIKCRRASQVAQFRFSFVGLSILNVGKGLHNVYLALN